MGAGYRMQAKGGGAAEIFIYEDVGESWFGGVTAKQFATDLRALGKPNAIDLRINSFGGDVFEGLAIYRLLADHPAQVTTYVDGIAASIASVIAMAGNEIRIAEAGEIMIHDAWTVAIGPAASLREIADRLDAVSSSIADIYVARTGKPKKMVCEWMAAETTFQSAAAVEHGFASAIVPNLKAAAFARPTAMHWRRSAAAASEPVIPADIIRPVYDDKIQQISRMKARHLLATTLGGRG